MKKDGQKEVRGREIGRTPGNDRSEFRSFLCGFQRAGEANASQLPEKKPGSCSYLCCIRCKYRKISKHNFITILFNRKY
jgi:hypothetical protein